MTIDERLTLVAQNLDTLTKLHLDLDQKTDARFAHMTAEIEQLARQTEARFAQMAAKIEQFAALTETRFIKTLDIIDRLAVNVEEHERRIDRLDRP